MQCLNSGVLLQNGKYKIEKALGQGGFGITYIATQDLLERKVCIKEFFFKDSCSRSSTGDVILGIEANRNIVERFLNKFIKEARTLSNLDHPHIIRIFDIFKENNTAYYVMDYIEGSSLEDIIKDNISVTESNAVRYITQVAGAIDYIHQRSINHLDIKPGNIMIRKSDNQAILIDFGVSKQYDSQGEQTSSTPVGVSVGYAPLEQSSVGGVGTFSPATDIYSLGATFYKLLTGQTPPDASLVLNEGLPEMPISICNNVKNAIIQAMDPRKNKRPQSIQAFLSLLDAKPAIINAVPQSAIQELHNNVSVNNEPTELEAEVDSNCEETALISPITQKQIEINNFLLSLGIKDTKATLAVDLGLSVKWANCNIGSSCVGDKGGLYGWGDITGSILSEDYYLHGKCVIRTMVGQ